HYPYTFGLLFALVYLPLQSAVASHIHFGQPVLDGLVAQLRLVPLCFYFVSVYVLHRCRVTLRELETIFSFLGVATLITAYVATWYVGPTVETVPEVGTVLKYDELRGTRLLVPGIFGEIAVFLWFRRFVDGGTWRNVLPVTAFILYLAVL